MSERVGPIDDHKYARWFSAHAHELKDRVPRPECSWKLSDTDLTLSELRYLRDAGVLQRVEDDEKWRTTERCIEAIRAYGRFGEDEDIAVECGSCGVCAGEQEQLPDEWLPSDREFAPRGREGEEKESTQTTLSELGVV